MKRLLIVVAVTVILLLLGGVIYLSYQLSNPTVKSFQDCVDKGYAVQESFPRRCVTPNGQAFIEEVPGSRNSGSESRPNTQTTTSIYFSKNPESLNDFTFTTAVERSTTRTDVATYSIEQLIAGPNAAEKARSLFSPLENNLTGTSNCNDKDFTLAVSNETATLKFCKTVESSGVGDDARIQSTVNNTLTQFTTVKKVTILDKNNNCFGDQSGLNLCKE